MQKSKSSSCTRSHKINSQSSHDLALQQVSVPNALAEAEMVMCGALSDLFDKTGVRPSEVDILITCCSIFCPTPSASALLVHKFGMREDVQSYSLGGMGCGTGVVGISLVRDLLKVCVHLP